jgi:ribosome-binding factor A
MTSQRQRKVAELLHEEISMLIQYGVEDARLEFVTVTGVEVSPDLRQARVYVTALDEMTEADTKAILTGLGKAAGYFRQELAQTLSLRYIPQLIFKFDTSLERGDRVEALLDTLKHEETNSYGGN